MTLKPTSRADLRSLAILIAALIGARMLFILLMPPVYSNDLRAWLRVMDVLQAHGNPYGQTEVLNWPPFWMQILFGIHHFCKRTGLSPTHGIQAVLIFGELLVLCAGWVIGRRWMSPKKLFLPFMLGLALNPASIFLSCQHCNYDVFVGLWILLGAGMLAAWQAKGRTEYWLGACFFIGMGILAKTVPLILAPLLLTGIKRLPWSLRMFGAALLLLPVTIGMSVLITLEPHGVMDHVIGYRSMGGWYGFSGLMAVMKAGGAIQVYKQLSPLLMLAVIGFVSWKSYSEEVADERTLLLRAALIILFVVTFGPGWSPPYLLWYLPLLVVLYPAVGKGLRVLLAVGLIVVSLTYAVEYAFFNSHGAYVLSWFSGADMAALSEKLGTRAYQTFIRLLMFCLYLSLFFAGMRQAGKNATFTPHDNRAL